MSRPSARRQTPDGRIPSGISRGWTGPPGLPRPWRCGLARLAAQRRIVEVGGLQGGGGVCRGPAGMRGGPANRAIEQPRIEVRQLEMGGQALGERALAGRRRPVDGDQEGFTPPRYGRPVRSSTGRSPGSWCRSASRRRPPPARAPQVPAPGRTWRCDGRDASRPGRRRRAGAGAVHDQVRRAHLVLHAVGQKAGGDAGQAVALGAQFGQAQHARRARSAGRGDGEDGILVDHRGAARSAGTSTPFSCRL